MANPRTQQKWPYRTGITVRGERVRKQPERARGVMRREAPQPRVRITPGQARVVLALTFFVLLVSGAWWAYRSPWLTVSEIEISGVAQVSAEQVRDAAALDGDSVFTLDLDAAAARVEQLPKVSGATVEKDGFNRVRITIQERAPWGAWQINGVDVPIDAEGYVLDGPPPPAGTPVIVEIDPKRVINAGDRLDPSAVEAAVRLTRESETAFGRRVVALVYRQESGLTAVLSGADVNGSGVWATFGDARNYDYKVASLYVLLEEAREKDLSLTTVDLRFGDRLSFK
ncbi:MAG: FtsQ-type POTRA domain-containing protein [Dehalococcoidia bacterium]